MLFLHRRAALDRGVGQCRHVFGSCQYQLKFGLVLELVEAREHLAGIVQPQISGHVSAFGEGKK